MIHTVDPTAAIADGAADVATAIGFLESAWAAGDDHAPAIQALAQIVRAWHLDAETTRTKWLGEMLPALAYRRTLYAELELEHVVILAGQGAPAGVLRRHLAKLRRLITDHRAVAHPASAPAPAAAATTASPWEALCHDCGWHQRFPQDRQAVAEHAATLHRMFWAKSTTC